MANFYEDQRTQLIDISDKIGNEWEQIAAYLGFTPAQVQNFKSDNTSTSNAIYNMLMKWVQNHPTDNYRDKMSWAFSKSKRNDLARLIKQASPSDGRAQQSSSNPENTDYRTLPNTAIVNPSDSLTQNQMLQDKYGEKSSEPAAGHEDKPDGSQEYDVMISYCWRPKGNHEKMIQLRDKLRENNLHVWMDIDEMYAHKYDRMVEGVKKSKALIACLSSEYEESQDCRSEYEFAKNLKKPIIPVRVNKYKLKGWLQLLGGNLIYRDVGSDELMKQNLPLIIEDLRRNLTVEGEASASVPSATNESRPESGL